LLSELRDNYVKTNQGSIWLTSNNNYVEGNSFYFYNKDRAISYFDLFDENKTTAQNLTNTTEFNKSGYYLVFVAVDADSNDTFGETDDFYQIFAFQYTTDTINISVQTVEDEPEIIGAGKYTNKNVVVEWEEPGIFDREISAFYHYGQSRDPEEVLKSTPYKLQSGDILGYEVTNFGSKLGWASYVVEIKSEGKAQTTRMFTIDTQPISGVGVYAVVPAVDQNGIKFYEVKKDKDLRPVQIKAISDSASTLYWDDKASEAGVTVSYAFTPFVKNTDNSFEVSQILKDDNAQWFTTNYKLGNTTTGLEIFKANVKGNGDLGNSQIFSQQGIYTFKLTDAAGNSCEYMFIIDKTEVFFRIDSAPNLADDAPNKQEFVNYATRSSELFAGKISYSVGTHKAIEISSGIDKMEETKRSMTDGVAKEMLASHINLIKQAIAGSLGSVDSYYYDEKYSNDNINDLNLLLQINPYDENKTSYIAVPNLSVLSLTSEGKVELETGIGYPITKDSYREIDHIEGENSGNSTIRELHILGKNQEFTTEAEDSKSYIVVEINKDNSLGTFFASDRKFNSTPEETDDVIRVLSDDQINLAHSTSNKYVAFRWEVGTGKFEVASVTYTYYEFDQTLSEHDGKSFYKAIGTSFTPLYNGNKYVGATSNGTQAYGILNESNGQTAEGLYKVTRKYKETGEDLGGDKLIYEYYIIVDRHGILDGCAGGEINIKLLESETPFNDFDVIGAEEKTLYSGDINSGKPIDYSVYLTTNKVPATVHIPVGKYFNSTTGKFSNYYSGKLKFEIYFNDIGGANHIQSSQKGHKLFEITEGDTHVAEQENGYYVINLKELFAGSNNEVWKKFGWEASNIGDDWLYLSGDYVVVVTDMVENVNPQKQNEMVFAFRVKHTKPSANIYVTTEKDSTVAVDKIENNKVSITTNQEFVKLELPKYNKNSLQAELDDTFLIVKRFTSTDGGETYVKDAENYIHHTPSGSSNATYSLNQNEYPVINNNGNYTIYLDTLLTRTNGKVTLWKDYLIKYEIEVRYRLRTNDGDDGEKYALCYLENIVTQNGTFEEKYYTNTFTIIIDRTPPIENTNNLVNSDNLIERYNKSLGINDLNETFVNTVYETSRLDFARQYNKYYNLPKNTEELYVFQVNPNTAYSIKDVDKIYISANRIKAEDLSTIELSLPIISSVGFDERKAKELKESGNKFIDIMQGKESGVYQIVEFDKAGNMVQYLIDYIVDNDSLNVNLEFNITYADGSREATAKLANGEFTAYTKNGQKIETSSMGNNLAFFALNDIKVETTENIYTVQLLRNTKDGEDLVVDLLVNLTTTPEDIASEIKKAIVEDYGYGGYTLKIKTRTKELMYKLTYINEEDIVPLELSRMLDSATHSVVNLKGANFISEEYNIPYYLVEIKISYFENAEQKVLTFKTKDGGENYYYVDENGTEFAEKVFANGKELKNNLFTTMEDGNTYIIQAVDMLTNPAPVYKFKSGDPTYSYYSLSFGEDLNNDGVGDGYSITKSDASYGYQVANIKYDYTAFDIVKINYSVNGNVKPIVTFDSQKYLSTFTSENVIYSNEEIIRFIKVDDICQAEIKLFPYFAKNGDGLLLEFEVELFQIGNRARPEKIFKVVFDTDTGKIRLKDNTTDIDATLNFAANVEIEETTYDSPSTGDKTLIWTLLEGKVYKYSYDLYETIIDGEEYKLVKFSLNDKNGSHKIKQSANSTGEYRFVITVLDEFENVLGRKIYTFAVKVELNKVYYVEYKDGTQWYTMEANSWFTKEELAGINFTPSLNVDNIVGKVPLFINNKEMRPLIINDNDVTQTRYFVNLGDGYSFEIYQLNAVTYKLYFGLLKTPSTENFINRVTAVSYIESGEVSGNVHIWAAEQIPETIDSTVLVGSNFELKFRVFHNQGIGSVIKNKNLLAVEVLYADNVSAHYVNTLYLQRNQEEITVKINGNGTYRFFVKDIAGNHHIFETIYEEEGFDYVEATFLQQVEISINGMAPINKAYYNDYVDFSVVKRENYEQGSISWEARRNGEIYASSSTTYSYRFEEYGTYHLTVKAKPKGFSGEPLTKSIVFTIVNEKEARKSFDLTNLTGYEIMEILMEVKEGDSVKEELVTDKFLSMLALSDKGMLVTYEMLLENLDIGSGKQTFIVKYRVNEGLYPVRDVAFKFTMNNDVPYIECSLKPGETTTKGFTISFNPGIIYKQIGESAIYVNGQLALTIDENSQDELMHKKFTQKIHGEGDFYITIQSSSGDIISTFKVTMKEPLNASAIIIIVVVSIVVIGVVVTIIVLRNKMKIR